MKYITLPNEKKLSKIGLGVSRFGTRITAGLADEMLSRFLAAGGTLIDTARNYYEWVENGRGKSEEFMGQWMETHRCRDKIVLSTKGGVSNEGKQFHIDLSREGLLTELRQSLEALRTDYLDIYLLHRDEPNRLVEEIIDSLQEIADEGRCENICKPICKPSWAAPHSICANVVVYGILHGDDVGRPDNDPYGPENSRILPGERSHCYGIYFPGQGLFSKGIRRGRRSFEPHVEAPNADGRKPEEAGNAAGVLY